MSIWEATVGLMNRSAGVPGAHDAVPYPGVPTRGKYMTKQKKPLRLKDIVELLKNPQFRDESRTFWAHYRTLSDKIGADRVKWERQSPAFMSSYLDPFTLTCLSG